MAQFDNFDDWYEQYQRDGGELMLFNTIDLEAAFEAGRKSGIDSALQSGL